MRRYFAHVIAALSTVALVTAGTAGVAAAKTSGTVSPTLRSALNSRSISSGSTATDTATLIGKGKRGAPTGTITFGVCGPTASSKPCVSPNAGSVTVSITPGAKDHSTASVTFSPDSTGWYCFLDQYGGDAHYKPVSDNDTSTECLDVSGGTKTTPTLKTSLSSSTITLGTSATDTATVTGSTAGGSPTGTVTFGACGPTSTPTPCTSPNVGSATAGLSPESGNRSVASATITPGTTGWYCFFDQYNGDGTYTSVTDNDTATECLDVTGGGGGGSTPTVSSSVSPSTIALGNTTTDTVTVTGNSTGGSPSGSVSFYVCGPSSGATPCTSTSEGIATVGLTAESGDRSVASLTVQVVSSTGWFCFLDQYNGDGTYTSASDNNSSTECVDVTGGGGGGSITPTVTSGVSPASIPDGGTTTDTVTVTGNSTGGSPSGSVSFYVCGPTSGPTPCTSTSGGLATVGLTGESGDRSVASLTVQIESSTGWFCFLDQYSGDGTYTSASDDDSSTECVDIIVGQSSTARRGSSSPVAVVSESSPGPEVVKA